LTIAIAAMVAALGVAQTGPTDPVGIYAVLDRVVVEPSDAAPQRIQVWGAFAIADPKGGYTPVATGYLYYSCPAGREKACRAEWEDLKWIAGTGKAIGYAQRGAPLGRLRTEADQVAAPDPYPLSGGLVKVESKDPNFTDLVARLKKAAGGPPDARRPRALAAALEGAGLSARPRPGPSSRRRPTSLVRTSRQ
jgi:hypothetical protein